MARFNALTNQLETPAEQPAKRSRRKAAPAPTAPAKPETELSRHVCRIPSATIAALLGDVDMTTAAAQTHRTAFADWCAARPHLQDWRPAWRLFSAELERGTAANVDQALADSAAAESVTLAADAAPVPAPAPKIIAFPDAPARERLAALYAQR